MIQAMNQEGLKIVNNFFFLSYIILNRFIIIMTLQSAYALYFSIFYFQMGNHLNFPYFANDFCR